MDLLCVRVWPRFRSDRTSAVCVVPPRGGCHLRRAMNRLRGTPSPEDRGILPASPPDAMVEHQLARWRIHHDRGNETITTVAAVFRDCCIQGYSAFDVSWPTSEHQARRWSIRTTSKRFQNEIVPYTSHSIIRHKQYGCGGAGARSLRSFNNDSMSSRRSG